MDRDAKSRLLYLAKILYEQTDENHYLTTAQLKKILEESYSIKAHRQTIKADIELLQEFGLKVQETRSTQNRYCLVERQFDITEIKQLLDAVASSMFMTEDERQHLTDKLTSVAGRFKFSAIKRNVDCVMSANDGTSVFQISETINQAINENRKIEFQYFEYNVRKEKKPISDGSPLHVTPLRIVWTGKHLCMLGIPDSDSQFHCFRIDRFINPPSILNETGISTYDAHDINKYLSAPFFKINGKSETVELICNNELMDAIIDKFGEKVVTYANDMTSFRVILSVTPCPEFYSWVFSFAGKVKIKAPQKVCDEYIQMLHASLAQTESN